VAADADPPPAANPLIAAPPPDGALLRSVGLWGLAALMLNGIVGAGVFALPGTVSHTTGSWAPLVVAGVGLAILPVVFIFIRLSRLFDVTGGPVAYVGEAFGPTAAFQVGWLHFLATVAAGSANVNLLADYAGRLIPGGASSLTHALLVLAALVVVLGINIARAGNIAAMLRALTVVKLAPLLFLVIVVVPVLVAHGFVARPPSHWSVPEAVLLGVYAYTGFEASVVLAGEARNPRRDLPRSVLGVHLAVVALYSLLTWGFVATSFDPAILDKAPLASMAHVLFGGAGELLIIVAATLSIFGNVITTVMINTRRVVALEAQATLPRWFGAVAPASGVPRNAVLFVGAVMVVLSLSGGFVVLALLSVAARLLVYLASVAALPAVRCRRRLPGIGGALIVPAAAIVTIILVAQSEPRAWVGLAVAMVIGTAVLMLARRVRG
jgi:basic amino acid/polyamine antiporter, APA family